MRPWAKLCWQGTRFCGDCLLWLVAWIVWLTLAAILVVQIYIASSHELTVPSPILRAMEERFAASNLRVTFGRIVFDPSGRILTEDTRIYLPQSPDPIVYARSVSTRLDLWGLLKGQFQPEQVEITGMTFYATPALSASGQHEAIVNDVQLIFREKPHSIEIDSLTAHIGSLALHASGSVSLAPARADRKAALPLADYIASTYPDICHRLNQIIQQLSALHEPSIDLRLTPSDTQTAIAHVDFTAQGLQLPQPLSIETRAFHASFEFPLSGDKAAPIQIQASTSEFKHADKITAENVFAQAQLNYTPTGTVIAPNSLDLSASSVIVPPQDVHLHQVTARLKPASSALVDLDLTAHFEGEPLHLNARVNREEESGQIALEANVSPGALDLASRRFKRDVREFVNFNAPPLIMAKATLKSGWKLETASARLWAGPLDVKSSAVDWVRGEIDFDGNHLVAHDVVMKKGQNVARGIYSMSLDDHEFRFLLRGELRPLEISDWFDDWWPQFFARFNFDAKLPEASVDVRGWWGRARATTVFVYMDAVSPVIEQVHFDHARTLLFIRPFFYEGMEVLLTQGPGRARGTFTRLIHLDHGLRYMDFDFDSTLDLNQAAKLFGTEGTEMVEPFKFENAPTAVLRGRIYGPAAPAGKSYQAHIEAQSTGGFKFYEFPLSNLSVIADVENGDVTVKNLSATFAEGQATGYGRLWTEKTERHLGFDVSIKHGNLAKAVSTLENFAAQKKGLPPPPPGKFLERSPNIQFDYAASAEGLAEDPLSYKGAGNAELFGSELGQVKLLGALSNILPFTSLRFTNAKASFAIDRNRLAFSEVNVSGSNSSIIGHGDYDMDKKQLAFNARVYPFRESKTLLQNLFDTVLTPISAVLEVKLSNTLENPKWAFVIGPTNFFKKLIESPTPPPAAGTQKAEEKPIPSYLKQ